MTDLSGGFYPLWVIAILIAMIIFYFGYSKNIINKKVKIISKTAFLVILPSTLFLGYLAITFDYVKAELEDQVDLIPGSQIVNSRPLWVFSKNKNWTYYVKQDIYDSYDYYKNNKKIKNFVFISKCGYLCLAYKDKNKELKILFDLMGKETLIDYFIQTKPEFNP